jgi:hypothetical protein
MMTRALALCALSGCSLASPPPEGEHSAPITSCSRSTVAPVVWPVGCQPVDASGATLCSTNLADHFVGRLAPTDPARQDKLVVFLTGDQSIPSQSTRLLTSFARYGFPTIGLSYDTDDAAAALQPCKELGIEGKAQTCYLEQRRRRLYGISNPAFPYAAVAPEDAVIPRLVALLNYLGATDPDGDWYRFLNFTRVTPSYRRIVFVGWSFGAGLVEQLGRDKLIQAGILLDGMKDPYDILGVVKNAPLSPGITAGCRLFGVYDANQPEPDMLLDQWTSIGMPWSPAEAGESLDGSLTDTIGIADSDDRRFFTEHACNAPHASFAVDASMYAAIDLANPATCTPATTADYQLRELYEDILCHAATTTCTTSHDPSCTSGLDCPADAPK